MLVPETKLEVVTSVEGDEVVMTVEEAEELVEVEVGVLEVEEEVVEGVDEVDVVEGVKEVVGVEAIGVRRRSDVKVVDEVRRLLVDELELAVVGVKVETIESVLVDAPKKLLRKLPTGSSCLSHNAVARGIKVG